MSVTAIKSRSAGIYARISADPDKDSASVPMQVKRCRELADRLGVTVAGDYSEPEAVSAYSGKRRPGWEQLVADVKAGKIDTILAWDTDRLYRRLQEYVVVVELVTGSDAEIHTVEGGVLDLKTPMGQLTATVKAGFNVYDSAHKSRKNTERAQYRATEQRRLVASVRPFGWRWRKPCGPGPDCYHPEKCTVFGQRPQMGTRAGLEPDPVEAPALVLAYRDVAEGLTLYAAHKRLAERVEVGKMTSSTLGTILGNARNAGLVTYKGEIVGEAKDGLRIVDRELFDKVAGILNRKDRRTSPGRPAGTWLGGGVLVCGKCGGPMSASNRHSRSGGSSTKAKVYICSRNKHLTRRRAVVDDVVLPIIADVLAELAERGKLTQTPAEDARATELQQQIDTLTRRLDEMAGLAATGVMTPVDFANAANIVRADIGKLKRELAARSNRPALTALSDVADVRAAWDGLLADGDTQRVRSILKDLTDNITANSDRSVTINWRAYVGLEPTTLAAPEPTISGRAERRQRVAHLHAQGMTISAIASEMGCDRATVRADLKAQGLYEQSA